MDDAPATAYRTRADYKRVVVTVVRNADSKQLTQDVTYVAPPGGGAYAGQNEGIVIAQVIDAALNTPVPGATVTLSAGPTPSRTRPHRRRRLRRRSPRCCRRRSRSTTTTWASPAPGYTTLRDDLPPVPLGAHAARRRADVPDGPPRLQAGDDLRQCAERGRHAVHRHRDSDDQLDARHAVVPAQRRTVRARSRRRRSPVSPSCRTSSTRCASSPRTARRRRRRRSSFRTAIRPTSRRPSRVTLGAPAAMQALTVKVVNAAGTRVAGRDRDRQRRSRLERRAHGHDRRERQRARSAVPSNTTPGYTTLATSGALTGTATGAVTAPTTRTVTVR